MISSNIEFCSSVGSPKEHGRRIYNCIVCSLHCDGFRFGKNKMAPTGGFPFTKSWIWVGAVMGLVYGTLTGVLLGQHTIESEKERMALV
jgi:hypothetical protein